MIELSIQEVASLANLKSNKSVLYWINTGKIRSRTVTNERGRPKHLIDLSSLPLNLQDIYYKKNHLKNEIQISSTKNLDEFDEIERDEIAMWSKIVKEWLDDRSKTQMPLGQFDEKYVAKLQLEYHEKGLQISRQILYKKLKALKCDDLDGLIDKRGKAKKGYTKINETTWEAFLSFYLDQRVPPIKKCYEYTRLWLEKEHPDLAVEMPDYCTFTRHVKQDIPEGAKILGRYGEKAYDDRCAPYIKRVYDNLLPNDVWVADNHTFDVMIQNTVGKHYRLYLTAFFDARTGIFTGIYITDAPSSQATIIALRNGIMKYGIPREIYVDNGREFLTFDVGGLGHRRKRNDERYDPTPIFERLGIKMTNALVRNAKAKIIERRFLDVKNGLSKLFESYTGGSVAEKPEQLKLVLKNGKAVLDETFRKQVKNLIEGYFNYQPYNGAVVEDRGKQRIQAFWEHMAETTKRMASKDELNLMLMRSTRTQKVGRRGVHLDINGGRIDYWNYDLLNNLLGEQVYLRYDPDDLKEVRIYDLHDRYIMSAPADNTTILEYGAKVEDVKQAMSITRRAKKIEKERMRSIINTDINSSTALELTLLQAQRNKDAEIDIPVYDIELQRAEEKPLIHKVDIENQSKIDVMLKNAAKNKGGHDNV